MKKNLLFITKVVAALVLLVFSLNTSTFAANPSYKIDMHYSAIEAVIPEELKAQGKERNVVIYVAEFTDIRQMDDKKVIGWVKEIDGSTPPLLTKHNNPSRIITIGIRNYLRKAGYKVADKIVQWDLQKDNIPKYKGKAIIGGTIDEMEISCWTGVFSNDYKSNMKLGIVVADPAKGKILYKSNVDAAFFKRDVSFSEKQLGQEASTALGDAIEKLFEKKTMTQIMKEAVSTAN